MAAIEKLTPSTKVAKASTTKPLTSLVTIFDPCTLTTHKCSINSKCVFNDLLDQSYHCDCFEGFEGEYCERDERPCLPHKNRCINNSTCNQSGRQYNCTCPSGFEGKNRSKNNIIIWDNYIL